MVEVYVNFRFSVLVCVCSVVYEEVVSKELLWRPL